MHIDYLIVGQGLAGSILAEHCLQSGLKIKVLSQPSLTNSSLVAGGLYNPITGRKMVKTWNCDKLFSYLVPFYEALEKKLESHFLHEIPIYRPFLDIEAQNEWMGKSSEGAYEHYVEKVAMESQYPEIQDDHGGIFLKRCGYLDTKRFVEDYESYLKNNDLLKSDVFDHNKLKQNSEGISYGDISAQGVIFCEGVNVTSNPLFDWLPFRPVKGELLTISTEHLPEVIYNRGVFIIGKKDAKCTVGATYDHNDLSMIATEKARNQLKEKLEKLINFDYSIVEQKVGIRPATKDRRPIIGNHPKMKNVYIFNGLGAKGVSLAPFYAKQLVSHLKEEGKLDDEVNIERYFSLF